MKENNAEGSRYLKTYGTLVAWVGGIIALLNVYAGFVDENYSRVTNSIFAFLAILFVYGISINLANINENIHRQTMIKAKESNQDRLDEMFDFKESEEHN